MSTALFEHPRLPLALQLGAALFMVVVPGLWIIMDLFLPFTPARDLSPYHRTMFLVALGYAALAPGLGFLLERAVLGLLRRRVTPIHDPRTVLIPVVLFRSFVVNTAFFVAQGVLFISYNWTLFGPIGFVAACWVLILWPTRRRQDNICRKVFPA